MKAYFAYILVFLSVLLLASILYIQASYAYLSSKEHILEEEVLFYDALHSQEALETTGLTGAIISKITATGVMDSIEALISLLPGIGETDLILKELGINEAIKDQIASKFVQLGALGAMSLLNIDLDDKVMSKAYICADLDKMKRFPSYSIEEGTLAMSRDAYLINWRCFTNFEVYADINEGALALIRAKQAKNESIGFDDLENLSVHASIKLSKYNEGRPVGFGYLNIYNKTMSKAYIYPISKRAELTFNMSNIINLMRTDAIKLLISETYNEMKKDIGYCKQHNCEWLNMSEYNEE